MVAFGMRCFKPSGRCGWRRLTATGTIVERQQTRRRECSVSSVANVSRALKPMAEADLGRNTRVILFLYIIWSRVVYMFANFAVRR